MKNYSWLPSKFVDDGIGLIINGVRFDDPGTNSARPTKPLEIRLSAFALSELQLSAEWNDWMRESPLQLTTQEIYGSKGRLGHLWEQSWNSPTLMLYSFLNNMGGGVPVEVIQEIVDICFREASVNNV